MAYALVLESEEIKKNVSSCRWIKALTGWVKGFFPAKVEVRLREIDRSVAVYFITMPCPKGYFSKNKSGKKLTMKKWASTLKEKEINRYLLEEPLKEYLDGGWSEDVSDPLAESLGEKLPFLLETEPLKGLKYETMTLALTGAEKQPWNFQLKNVLKKFKLINAIEQGPPGDDRWEEFMMETGIPVCRTNDCRVLQRSEFWFSFQEDSPCFFKGIKLDIPLKTITDMQSGKKFKIGYDFGEGLGKKLGRHILRRFDHNLLSCFLVDSLTSEHQFSVVSAEEFLGIEIVAAPAY